MLKSKLFYVMAIAYIAVFATVFGLFFPSVSLQSVATIISLLGFVFASASYYLIQRMGLLNLMRGQ